MNKDFPFTEIDLKHLELTLTQKRPDAIWARAFAYYQKQTGVHLSIVCRPCYEKVYRFVLLSQNT
jgi:hypothetical protein